MLQFVEVCCIVLQCGVVWCSALQCIAVHCSALQCVAVRCSALQCVAVCCSVLQCISASGSSPIEKLCLYFIFPGNEPYILPKRALFESLAAIATQKSPTFPQNSPTWHQKSPMFHQKSPKFYRHHKSVVAAGGNSQESPHSLFF